MSKRNYSRFKSTSADTLATRFIPLFRLDNLQSLSGSYIPKYNFLPGREERHHIVFTCGVFTLPAYAGQPVSDG